MRIVIEETKMLKKRGGGGGRKSHEVQRLFQCFSGSPAVPVSSQLSNETVVWFTKKGETQEIRLMGGGGGGQVLEGK